MEPPIPHNLIDRVVSVAENMADELIRTDGRQVQLEEDQDLQLPFLLPEDGYSCDTIKGKGSGGLVVKVSAPQPRDHVTSYDTSTGWFQDS
jgi:hypothetical protein